MAVAVAFGRLHFAALDNSFRIRIDYFNMAPRAGSWHFEV